MMETQGASARRARRLPATVAALSAILLAAACGGGSSTPPAASAAPTSSAASTSSGASGLTAFEALVDQGIATRSQKQTVTPPADGPKAAKGKTVYVIACILAAEGCARESRTAVTAAEAIGWTVKLIDTGSVPAKMADAVAQAINAKADGIIIQAIDAKFIAGPLAKAKAAGIKMVCFACVNSNSLMDETIPTEQNLRDDGYALGQQMYKSTAGHPRLVIMYDASFAVTGFRREGTEKFFSDCQTAGGDCKILETKNFLVTELTTRVPSLASQVARAHPDMNAMWMSYDSAESFLTQGLRQAGVARDKVGLYGFDGNQANIKAIREGDFQVASLAGPFEWIGWAEVDSLNRLFQGQQPVPNIIRTKLMTKANVPSTDIWAGDEPYQDAYKKAWGV